MKQKSVSEYPSILREILSYVETSMTSSEIMALATNINVSQVALESTTVPGDEVVAWGGEYENAGWVWIYETSEASEYIHKWIYGEDKK
jgi:anionic cell wall polymer biosynthesis LytR-Cps2A-Psr (LCP) family protein